MITRTSLNPVLAALIATALLAALHAEGVTVDDKREDHDYGRFAWIVDPEGNRIELWEPPAGS